MAEPSKELDPVLWDEACRIYGFVGGVDPVTLAPQQREIIDRAYAALGRFRAEGVEAERERCAKIAHAARSEAELERHKATDDEEKACWLWAFDTSNGIERRIRSGETP